MTLIKDEIHEDDIGTVFQVTVVEDVENPVAVDLTGYTSIDFIFKPPTQPSFSRNATIVDVANGIISYTTISGDLNETGRWKLQIDLTLPAWDGKSDIGEFVVYENL